MSKQRKKSARNIFDLGDQRFLEGRIIAISISEYSKEYGVVEGVDMPHVNSAFSIFALHFMSAGAKLLYGGEPNYKGRFNYVERLRQTSQLYGGSPNWRSMSNHARSSLIELCQASRSKKAVSRELSAVVRHISNVKRPVVNLVPYPWSKGIQDQDISRFASFLQVLVMPERKASPTEVSTLNDNLPNRLSKINRSKKAALEYYDKILGLHEMRYLQTCVEHGRVILGGKRVEFSGAYPGLLDEAILTMQAGNPLYILSGFGGAAGLIGDFLIKRYELRKRNGVTKQAQSQFKRLRKQLIDSPFRRFEKVDTDSKKSVNKKLENQAAFTAANLLHEKLLGVDRSIDRFVEFLEDVSLDGKKHLSKGLNNGLSTADNIALMSSKNINEAVELTMRGLRWLVNHNRI